MCKETVPQLCKKQFNKQAHVRRSITENPLHAIHIYSTNITQITYVSLESVVSVLHVEHLLARGELFQYAPVQHFLHLVLGHHTQMAACSCE